jgi:capsular exopolysaccharide synthesis family protein
MSQIFDALNQSVTERGSLGGRDFSAAKELLQVVERKTSGSTLLVEPPPPHTTALDAARVFPSVNVTLPFQSRFVCFGKTDTLAAEKFRFLATRLRHLQQKHALKRLVITSSVPGEGKSMVAANLACALATGKQQVLLLEGDLRRPSLGSQLGLQGLPGMSQMLQGMGSGENIYRLEGSGLCVLLAGDVHNNPLELMEAGKLAELMDRVSSGFDWVVIDSPPVLPLADTSIWIRLADSILMVTRPGVTAKKQLQRGFEAIEQSKLLGTVLNASAEATTNHYYYHYASRPAHPQAPKSDKESALLIS